MHRTLLFWILWFVFLFVVDFVVPFVLLRDVSTVAGSFLFWIIWIGVAVASMFYIFMKWRDPERG